MGCSSSTAKSREKSPVIKVNSQAAINRTLQRAPRGQVVVVSFHRREHHVSLKVHGKEISQEDVDRIEAAHMGGESPHWEAQYDAIAKHFPTAKFVAVDLEDVKAWTEFTGILFQPPQFLPYVQVFRAGGAVVPKWKGSSVDEAELRDALASLNVAPARGHLLGSVKSSALQLVPRPALRGFRLSRVKGFLVRSGNASTDRGRAIRSGGWAAVAAAAKKDADRNADLLRVPSARTNNVNDEMIVVSTRGKKHSFSDEQDPDAPYHERARRGSLAQASTELSAEMAYRSRTLGRMESSITPASGSSRMLNELSTQI